MSDAPECTTPAPPAREDRCCPDPIDELGILKGLNAELADALDTVGILKGLNAELADALDTERLRRARRHRFARSVGALLFFGGVLVLFVLAQYDEEDAAEDAVLG